MRLKQIMRDFISRFDKPIPLYLKRVIYALYSAVLFAQGLAALPPEQMAKLAVGAITLHFVIELFYPTNGNPPKLLVWLLIGGLLLQTGCRDAIIKARFGKQAKDSTLLHVSLRDTVTFRDTVTIPKDSIIARFRVDTSAFHRTYETKRTRLVIDHPKGGQMTVEADCKPDTVYQSTTITNLKSYTVNGPPTVSFDLGVSKWYKYGLYAALLAVLALLVGGIIMALRMYEVSMPTITRRGSGMGFKQGDDGH